MAETTSTNEEGDFYQYYMDTLRANAAARDQEGQSVQSRYERSGRHLTGETIDDIPLEVGKLIINSPTGPIVITITK